LPFLKKTYELNLKLLGEEKPLFELTARTFQGFEKLVAKELEKTGAKDIYARKRTVDFRGDLACIYRTNLQLRTATKILKKISFFKAVNDQYLNKHLMAIDWSKFLMPKDKFNVSVNVSSKFFNNPAFISNKFKNCILEHFKQNKKDFVPDYDANQADIKFHFQVFNEYCTIFIDSTGDFLFNRHYKAENSEEDLNEVMAAGMLLMSNWKPNMTLIDPMCGSGTILFEAAFIANNIPPGIYRSFFGFMKWKDFNKSVWESVVAEAKANIVSPKAKIYGFDKNPVMISLAKKNLIKANLLNKIHFETKAFSELNPPTEKGIIVTEPPSSERIDRTDILTFYERFGNMLKEKFVGYNVAVLCPNKDALLKLKLSPRFKIVLLNGKNESFFETYYVNPKPQKEND